MLDYGSQRTKIQKSFAEMRARKMNLKEVIPFIKESGDPRAGNFEFVYSDAMNHIRTYAYKLDSSSEGTMVFFPAEMNHQVFPFYNCEEERISISGNIAYDG